MRSVVDLVTFAVLALAAVRLTKLGRWDKITEPLRATIVNKTGPGSALSYLFHCHRCLSVWAALTVAAAHFTWPGNPVANTFLVGLAAAEIAVLYLDRLEPAGGW